MLFAGPLIGILILYFIFQQGTVKNLPIVVVDRDQSSLSVKISNALSSAPEVRVVATTKDLDHAREMMRKGKIEAIVLIPDETEKHVYQKMDAPIPVYINGTNVLKAGLIQKSVLTTLKTYSGGIQLKRLLADGLNEEQAMGRVVPVKVEKHVLFNPYTNYNYFLNSAMLYVMLYLFVFLSSIYTLGNELKRGTGKDLLVHSNNSVRTAIVGKMLTYTIIFSGFAMFINYLLYVREGMPLNGSYFLIFVGQFITILTYQLLGLVFISVTSNLRLAMSLGSAYSMMGITFSGLTYPMEAMPFIAQAFRALFPFTWWEQIMISQSLRGAPVEESLPYFYYILLFQVLAFCFLGKYKRQLSDPKYWGKK
jgi:ABC-2 type transport system permease protein